jgi:hypothetical protein
MPWGCFASEAAAAAWASTAPKMMIMARKATIPIPSRGRHAVLVILLHDTKRLFMVLAPFMTGGRPRRSTGSGRPHNVLDARISYD